MIFFFGGAMLNLMQTNHQHFIICLSNNKICTKLFYNNNSGCITYVYLNLYIKFNPDNKNTWIKSDNFYSFTVMQVGFASLEAGCINSKNVTNIILKNVLDTCKYTILSREHNN